MNESVELHLLSMKNFSVGIRFKIKLNSLVIAFVNNDAVVTGFLK